MDHPTLFVCLVSGNVHVCPGADANPSSGVSEVCGFVREAPGEMASVCDLTGTYQASVSANYQDDVVDKMVLETRAEKYKNKVQELREAAKEKARTIILRLIYGDARAQVEEKSSTRQQQMRLTLERRWRKIEEDMANGKRTDKSAIVTYLLMMRAQLTKENKTFMQRPVEDQKLAENIASAVVREAMIVLDAMNCPDKDLSLGCVAYMYNMRRGVNNRRGVEIIPEHDQIPAPLFYRVTDIEIPGLSRLRQLTTATGRQVQFIMEHPQIATRLMRIYSGAAGIDPAMPKRIKRTLSTPNASANANAIAN